MISFLKKCWEGEQSLIKVFIAFNLVPSLFAMTDLYSENNLGRIQLVDSELFSVSIFITLSYFFYIFVIITKKRYLSFYALITTSFLTFISVIYLAFLKINSIIDSTNLFELIIICSVNYSVFFFLNLTKNNTGYDDSNLKKYKQVTFLLGAIVFILLLLVSQATLANVTFYRFAEYKDCELREIIKSFLKEKKGKVLKNTDKLFLAIKPYRFLDKNYSSLNYEWLLKNEKEYLRKVKKRFSYRGIDAEFRPEFYKDFVLAIIGGEDWCNERGCYMLYLLQNKDGLWQEYFEAFSNGARVNSHSWNNEWIIFDNLGTGILNPLNKEYLHQKGIQSPDTHPILQLEEYFNKNNGEKSND